MIKDLTEERMAPSQLHRVGLTSLLIACVALVTGCETSTVGGGAVGVVTGPDADAIPSGDVSFQNDVSTTDIVVDPDASSDTNPPLDVPVQTDAQTGLDAAPGPDADAGTHTYKCVFMCIYI